jgi:hypothetical protein
MKSSTFTPRFEMGDAEAHGKALEQLNNSIQSALVNFLVCLENEPAWWYYTTIKQRE